MAADPGTVAQAVPSPADAVLIDALADLQERKLIEFREWRNEESRWAVYAVEIRDCFYRRFEIRMTFKGGSTSSALKWKQRKKAGWKRMPVARLLEAVGHTASLRELKEGHYDLTKRPDPDLTGVVQHCMAALECTAKLIAGVEAGTLHDLLKSRKLNLPPHLSAMLDKAWGFASDRGRHVKEGKPVSYRDAELMLYLCEGMIVYVLRSAPGAVNAVKRNK